MNGDADVNRTGLRSVRARLRAFPRVGCGSGDIGAHCHSDAFGTIGFEGRVRKATQAVLEAVRDDAVCRQLMTVPGGGPLVAITYK